jgi:hypothetical protein
LNGLNASKRVIAARKSNMFIGCDLDGEEDSVNAVYLPETEKVKIKVSYKYGVQIAFPRSCNTKSNCIINIIYGGCNNPPIITK